MANSTPMVDFDSRSNAFLVNLERMLLLPTPESPINTTEINPIHLYLIQLRAIASTSI